MAALRVSASAGADGPVVVLSGEADPTTATVLREMLAAQLETGARLVTVDASGLSFLDSASVRVLVLAARALQGRHGRLVLARPQPIVARLLEITGADRLLDVRELAGPPPRSVPRCGTSSTSPPTCPGRARLRPRSTPARTARAPRSRGGVMVPVPVRVTAASEVTGISPLNSPVRSTPRRSMAPYQAMNTSAVIAIVR
jgi:anti-anti-sigma factor